MADSGLSALQGQAAGAYARAEAVAVPVRPLSPAQPRPRFNLDDLGPGDLGQVVRRPLASDPVESGGTRPQADAAEAPARGQSSAGSDFSAFQTQIIAQDEATESPPASAFLAGARAYARPVAEARNATLYADPAAVFPRLASGRTLDLSV